MWTAAMITATLVNRLGTVVLLSMLFVVLNRFV
jgi:hypothetical protein